MGETQKKQGNSGIWATMKPFVNGGVSGMMSISVVQPVDMVKFVEERMSLLSKKRNRPADVSDGLNMKFACQVVMQVLKVDDGGPYQNMACSPLSISAALCVLVAGSKGRTRKQLLRVMEHNNTEEVSDMASRLAEILKEDEKDKDTPTTSAYEDKFVDPLQLCMVKGEDSPHTSYANGLWVAHPLTLKNEFKQLLWDVYKTQATTLDFLHQGDKVVDEVNLWAEKQSKGLIKQIISRDCINKYTAMIMANALYFEGVWVKTFEPRFTEENDFFLLNGSKVQVPFMKKRDTWFSYGMIEGCKIINMPYRGGKAKNTLFSMYIFLPDKKNGLPTLLQDINMDVNLFNNQIRLEPVRITKLHIPKFEFEYSVSLPETMKNLGLTRIFDEYRCDLQKMVHLKDNDQVLYVSEIHHKCRIEINEEGTKASSLTRYDLTKFGYGRSKAKPPPSVNFVANHPFMFMIREEFSGAILFVGTVLDPLSS